MPGVYVITICRYCVSVADGPDASKSPAIDVEALTQSLANVYIEEKVSAVLLSGAETVSPALQNSNTDQDTSVDSQR